VGPNLYRLMAQERGSPLSHREIAKRSGLSARKVRRISQLKGWETVAIAEAEAFARGCGFQLGQHARILAMLHKAATKGLLSLRHMQSRGSFQRKGGQANLIKCVTNTLV
jgi:hypothetical protein